MIEIAAVYARAFDRQARRGSVSGATSSNGETCDDNDDDDDDGDDYRKLARQGKEGERVGLPEGYELREEEKEEEGGKESRAGEGEQKVKYGKSRERAFRSFCRPRGLAGGVSHLSPAKKLLTPNT